MKNIVFIYLLLSGFWLSAQENLNYQKPTEEILELAEAPMAPSIRIDSNGENMMFLYRSNFSTAINYRGTGDCQISLPSYKNRFMLACSGFFRSSKAIDIN